MVELHMSPLLLLFFEAIKKFEISCQYGKPIYTDISEVIIKSILTLIQKIQNPSKMERANEILDIIYKDLLICNDLEIQELGKVYFL